MKVKLINYTPSPEELVAKAGKLCYSPVGVDEIEKNLTDLEVEKFVKQIVNTGHHSVLEHISFTFAVEGVSRALLSQLTRHRLASYSVQSQRYVELDSPDFIIPDTVKQNNEAYKEFVKSLNTIVNTYNQLIKMGIPKEDARAILPNATETKIVFTMNARSLMNFFELRCCSRSQSEIFTLAHKMLVVVKEVAPSVFEKAGASCVRGKCKEGKMTCGNPQR